MCFIFWNSKLFCIQAKLSILCIVIEIERKRDSSAIEPFFFVGCWLKREHAIIMCRDQDKSIKSIRKIERLCKMGEIYAVNNFFFNPKLLCNLNTEIIVRKLWINEKIMFKRLIDAFFWSMGNGIIVVVGAFSPLIDWSVVVFFEANSIYQNFICSIFE